MSLKKVLLAEDDADFAGVLKQYLELYQFEIIWAENGEEALAIFQTKNFCLIFFLNSFNYFRIFSISDINAALDIFKKFLIS